MTSAKQKPEEKTFFNLFFSLTVNMGDVYHYFLSGCFYFKPE